MKSFITKMKSRLNITNKDNKSIFFNSIGSLLIKGGALIISLLTMPFYIEYFDNKQVLGLWFTLLSVLSWVLTFDFGIGNGLRNRLVVAIVNKDDKLAKRYISSTYIIIAFIVSVILLIFTFMHSRINWNVVFNIEPSVVEKEILSVAVFIVFTGIMLQFFLKIITSVLYALQKAALINLLSLLSSLIILIYVSNVDFDNVAGNLISLSLIHTIAVNFPLLIITIFVFSTRLKNVKPNIKYFGKKYAKDVIILGGIFFWVQLMYMLITGTNEILISWLSDPGMVVEYQIYNKVFTTLGIFFTLALSPIWSAVTKALSEKNYLWIKKLYNNLKVIALLGVALQFLVILFLQLGINLWLGDNTIQVNYKYAITFASFGSIFIWSGVLSSIANGLGHLKVQSILFTIGVIIKIPIAWLLVEALNSWIGVVIANIIAMGLYCVIQPYWLNKFLNKNS